MFSPTVRHRCWKVTVDPVKWMPARSRCGSATVDTACPSPVTRLITPGGSPAASSRRIVTCAASCWVGEGFHTATLPSRAGAVGRLPAIEVKLNGVIARTKPSSGRYSIRFQVPGADCGCSASSRRAKWTLNRQKSISSAAASISAWYTDLDWPAIVAAFSVARDGHVLVGGVVHGAEHVPVVVRRDHVDGLTPAGVLVAADRHGQLGSVAGQLLDLAFQGHPIRAARRVLPDRLVDRRRHGGDSVHERPPWSQASLADPPMLTRGSHRSH